MPPKRSATPKQQRGSTASSSLSAVEDPKPTAPTARRNRAPSSSAGGLSSPTAASLFIQESNGSETCSFYCHGGAASSSSLPPMHHSSIYYGRGGGAATPRSVLSRWAFRLISPLMPEGYPTSVSPDYGAYQLFDTLQCLCSSVTGTLSTRAVLMGVGVGQAEATALSGTVSWLMRDVCSKIGAVWFAAYHATDLDNDAKKWRFVADLANDTALFLEIFSVHLPAAYFMICVCVASLFKAICGVAGGSSRASLTQHFSIRHNMADVAAKDGSQETMASLLGMFIGMFIAWVIPETNFMGTVVGFVFFTAMHLLTNYLAVTSLVLTHFNRHRARHCIRAYLSPGGPNNGGAASVVMGCVEANKKESVLMLGKDSREPFTVVFGARASDVLKRYGRNSNKMRGSDTSNNATLAQSAIAKAVAHMTQQEEGSGQCFAIIANPLPNTCSKGGEHRPQRSTRYDVLLAEGASEEALWAYYLICKDYYGPPSGEGAEESMCPRLLLPSPQGDGYNAFRAAAIAAGWELDKLQFRILEWRVGGGDGKSK